MSVILYDDEKFLRIYETMRLKSKEYAYLFDYPEGWNDAGVMDSKIRAFAQDLRRANTITWNRQYADDQQPLTLLEIQSPPFVSAMPYPNKIQFYKSLQGLRYNLIDNGGGESNLCDCFERLNRLIDHVAYDIIGSMPEYETANTW